MTADKMPARQDLRQGPNDARQPLCHEDLLAITSRLEGLIVSTAGLSNSLGQVQSNQQQIAALVKQQHRDRRAGIILAILGVLLLIASIMVVRAEQGNTADAQVKDCRARSANAARAVLDYDQLLAQSSSLAEDKVLRDFIMTARESANRNANVRCRK